MGGKVDEAELLAEAIAGVMKYVPIPDREMGIVGDIGTLGVALYLTVGKRLQIDAAIAAGQAPPIAGVPTAEPAARPRAVPDEAPPPPSPSPADVLESMGDTPLVGRAQTVEVQPGPRDPLAFDADPEVALFERTQPEGAVAAHISDLVDGDSTVPLLERLAPPPTVG